MYCPIHHDALKYNAPQYLTKYTKSIHFQILIPGHHDSGTRLSAGRGDGRGEGLTDDRPNLHQGQVPAPCGGDANGLVAPQHAPD